METKCHQRVIRETVGIEPLEVQVFEPRGEVQTLANGMSFSRIPIAMGRAFIEKYEWLGHAGRALIFYGAWKDEDGRRLLYGVEAFCPLPFGCSKQIEASVFKKSLYLARGACALAAGPNAGSMLIGAALRDLRKRGVQLVLAFADPRAGESGGCYRAANAEFGGLTKSGARYYFYQGQWMTNANLWRSHGLKIPQLPEGTPRRVDKGQKLRFYWVLDRRARKGIPAAWSGLKFDPSLMAGVQQQTVEEAMVRR